MVIFSGRIVEQKLPAILREIAGLLAVCHANSWPGRNSGRAAERMGNAPGSASIGKSGSRGCQVAANRPARAPGDKGKTAQQQ
jgi:hypothetical protein